MTAVVTPAEAQQFQAWHLQKLEQYKVILGDESKKFFDAVVVTSGDADQTKTYEQIIEEFKQTRRIPLQTKYIVKSDPPGRRVGCGGATFYVLDELQKDFGRVDNLKVLLIHAGGYSKRLPNHSHCGKIFSLLPVPSPADPRAAMTMLELKLASFAHVVEQIPEGKGGVFTTCSDDLIFYDHTACDFSQSGFTALGHPSPITIGKDHGVFVLSKATQDAGIQKCKRFLHKPPVEKQRDTGAVVGKTQDDQDEVYTDSSYFFSGDIAALFLKLFHEAFGGCIKAEVDAYGDFMHPLGPDANTQYLEDFSNTAKADVSEERQELQRARQILFDALKGRDLYCCALPGSRFYHVGTLQEAIHHFSEDHGLLTALGTKVPPANVCTIESLVAPSAKLGGEGGTVIEYSRVGDGCVVGGRCVVSGVELPAGTTVSSGTFLQTLPVTLAALPDSVRAAAKGLGETVYVTHILGTSDDIKKGRKEGEPFPIFGGANARDYLAVAAGASLWNARLFPVCATAGDSLAAALELQSALAGKTSPKCWAEPALLVSLGDCVMAKALTHQRSEKAKLLKDIQASL